MNKEYDNAVKCSKQMLELSWICGLIEFEIDAYSMLSI